MDLPIDLNSKFNASGRKWRLIVVIDGKQYPGGTYDNYGDAWRQGKLRMSNYPEIDKIKVV